MDCKNLRQEFEAWVSVDPFCESIERYPDDPTKHSWHNQYKSLKTALAWEAWQESHRITKEGNQ